MPDHKKPAISSGIQKLADYRLARGLTQSDLGRRIGVSRQFLNQMEAGRVLPNVAVALRLASALERTVEELFGAAAVAADGTVPVTLAVTGLAPGTRLKIGRVGRVWMAHPADTAGTLAAGFTAADAVLESPSRARLVVAPAVASANLLLAGCDPALALLQPATDHAEAGRCHWIDCSSGQALDLLTAGQVHVAGIHYAGTEGSGNLQELRRRDPQGKWSLFRFSRWAQGWLVQHGRGRQFSGISSLATGNWTLANRSESTAARRWLDRELAEAHLNPARIPGYHIPIASAADGAQAVASGRADVTVGPQALALAHGLDFIPAEAVDFDLAATTIWWRSDAGRKLKNRIHDLANTGVLATLPGYAPTRTGTERPRKRAPRRAS